MSIYAAGGTTYNADGRLLRDTPVDLFGRGELFLDGDAFTDGSVRFIKTSNEPMANLESRLNGVFDGAQVLVDDLLIQRSTGLIIIRRSDASLVVRRTQR